MNTKSFKVQKLRNNEYYKVQKQYDMLYEQSKQGNKFKNLMMYITDERNILLAFRNIKTNKGSRTQGTDGRTIEDFKELTKTQLIEYVRCRLINYKPNTVRRKLIPKANGKTRPLGIPCMGDRIVQQCILQVLEPICEAKFHNHSYGFRPNRSAHHAIARSMSLVNGSKKHYVVDIDIKGFFDNINHAKLIKQLWTLGIQDKTLLVILKKILSSEIQGEGIQTKGTPQGGIISPLLSNIVLNELDWWISNQWETFETKHQYFKSNKYRAIRATKLKEMYIVRYADDFKIFTTSYNSANRIYHATKKWLTKRLHLEISEEKSSITNLRKKNSEFLGFSIGTYKKREKIVCHSHVSIKAQKAIRDKIRKQIITIKYNTVTSQINRLNSQILGMQNYYNIATHVAFDFHKIAFSLKKTFNNRLKLSEKDYKTKTYTRLYSTYKGKIMSLCGVNIFPLGHVRFKVPLSLSQKTCKYTELGRLLIHKEVQIKSVTKLICYLLATNHDDNAQLADNKLSLLHGQYGQCGITKLPLKIGRMECHHKIPKSLGGNDDYNNLIWLDRNIHKLIHATNAKIIYKYKNIANLNKIQLTKLNLLRKLSGNSIIE